MASLYKKDGIYQVQYYRNGTRFQESLKTRDYKTAKHLKALKEIELGNPSSEVSPSNINPYEVLEQYNSFTKYSKSPKTLYNDNIRIKSFLDYLKISSLVDISERSFQQYLNWRFENKVNFRLLTQAGANHIITTIKFFLKWCVKQRFIKENPLQDFKLFKLDKTPKDFFSFDEIDRILEASKQELLYGMIATAYYTGMRKGELLRFKWMDIDYKRNLVIVYKAKSKKFREIPLNAKLKEILEGIRANRARGVDLFCFPKLDERCTFKRICKAANVSKINWHKFRHTFASHLVQKGVSIYKVSKYLGHSTTSTTEIYAHLQPTTDTDINTL